MFYSVKLYFRDRWILVPLAGAILVQAFLWWYLISNIRPEAGQIFLHKSIPFGVDLVGEWWRLYLVPLAGVMVVLVNYALSYLLYSIDKFLARLLSGWVLFFHLFLLVGMVIIIRLNI